MIVPFPHVSAAWLCGSHFAIRSIHVSIQPSARPAHYQAPCAQLHHVLCGILKFLLQPVWSDTLDKKYETIFSAPAEGTSVYLWCWVQLLKTLFSQLSFAQQEVVGRVPLTTNLLVMKCSAEGMCLGVCHRTPCDGKWQIATLPYLQVLTVSQSAVCHLQIRPCGFH